MSGISSRHILCRQTEYRSIISPDHRLCRFAKISGHPAISRIAVYFGSPKHRGIYLISIGISQIFIDFTGYHDSSIIRVYQNIIASISRCSESKNIYLTKCYALRNISTRHLTSAHGGRMSNSARQAVCRSSLCCRHTFSVMPKKARNRYIMMPKQATCRSSTCCRHVYEVKAQSGRNRHKKYAHEVNMSNQLCWRHLMSVNRHRKYIYAHGANVSNQLELENIGCR